MNPSEEKIKKAFEAYMNKLPKFQFGGWNMMNANKFGMPVDLSVLPSEMAGQTAGTPTSPTANPALMATSGPVQGRTPNNQFSFLQSGDFNYNVPNNIGYTPTNYFPDAVNPLNDNTPFNTAENFAKNNPLPYGIFDNSLGYSPATGEEAQVNYTDRINLLNPYGGIDNGAALEYGLYNFGKGETAKGILGTAKAGLGFLREGLSAYGTGKAEKYTQDQYQKQQYGAPGKYIRAQQGGEFSMALTPEQEQMSQAPQKPIHHIQKVDTTGYKDNGQLPPGSYYKVYYTDPNRAKVENQDFEYIDSSGYSGLQRMDNYRIYMQNQQKQVPQGNNVATLQQGGFVDNVATIGKSDIKAFSKELQNSQFAKNIALLGKSNMSSFSNMFDSRGQLVPIAMPYQDVVIPPAELPQTPILQEGGGISEKKNPDAKADSKTVSIAESLTGEYATEVAPENKNSELEGGEWVKDLDTGDIQKVVGDSHKDGGVDMNLSNAQVITAFTKVGPENAKHFAKEWDIKVKPKDTFAQVLDKYNKKIDLEKLTEDEVKLTLDIEKQQTAENPDKNSQDLNMQFLSGKMKEIQEKKEPLKVLREAAFQQIFERQEKMGKKGKDGEILKEGGLVENLAKQYNLPTERITQLLEDMKNQPKMQYGGRISNKYEDPAKYIKQSQIGVSGFGEVIADNFVNQALENQRIFPELAQKYFTQNKYRPDDVTAYQNGINSNYDQILADSAALNYTKEEQDALRAQIEQNRFLKDDSVRGIDGKYGNYTSTRPNFELRLLPKEELAKVKADGVNSTYQLKAKYPELYDKYVASKGVKSDAFLGEIPTPEVVADTATTPAQPATQIQYNSGVNFGFEPFLLPPSAPVPVYKGDVTFGQLDPNKVSIEPNLVEGQRQLNSVQESLQGLPDSQRGAVLAQLFGQNQVSTNDAISKAEAFNAAAQTQADTYNLGADAKEQLTNLENAYSYEQRDLQGQANFERDLRGYFTKLNDLGALDELNRNKTNAYNSMFEHYKIQPGAVRFNDNGEPLVVNNNGTLNPNQIVIDKSKLSPSLLAALEKSYKKR